MGLQEYVALEERQLRLRGQAGVEEHFRNGPDVQPAKRAAVLARSTVITAHELGHSLEENSVPSQEETESALQAAVRAILQQSLSEVQRPGAVSPFHEIVGQVEEILVGEALTLTSGNQLKAAELLGLNRATLRKRMRSYRS